MSELKPCPFCGVNKWQYHAHFSGASVFQCEKCGTIVDECVLNTRPIEDALQARIAELEAELNNTKFHAKTLQELLTKSMDRIAEMEADLKNARELIGMTPEPAFPAWIPVSERLPEDGEVVWLWDGNNLGMGYYLVFAGQFMDRDTPLRRIKPTHWMSLPTPPEVQE